jgi:hypothetical protein
MDSLMMHAILRLPAQPVGMATDYLLAMAAREGHLLERRAVEDLYITKGRDLRACITELNFRCQMGIGDRKGGLDWMISRWPPGCDLDPSGDQLRVVSKGTYISGMEWENNDIVLDEPTGLMDELSLSTSLTDWDLPIDDLAFNSNCKLAGIDPLSTIEILEVVTNARSSADVYCQGRLRTGFKVCFLQLSAWRLTESGAS